jgi:hypothetical protein
VLRLQREEQRAADPGRSDDAKANSTLRESRVTERAGLAAAAFPGEGGVDRRQGGPLPPLEARRSRLRPPVGADDAHLLLMIAAEPQFGRGEQPIDDHVVALDAVVHELGAALRADHPERRHLALADAARELDEHLPPVVEGAQRPPGRIVALDR